MSKYFPKYMKRYSLITIIIALILLISSLILIKLSGITYYVVSGDSMLPTFKSGNILFVKKGSRNITDGNIIVFKKSSEWVNSSGKDTNNKTLIKRIVAVPGDEISYDTKTLSVNGKVVFDFEENNYKCEEQTNYTHILNDNEIFVMGDNALESADSKYFFCQDVKDFYVHPDQVKFAGQITFKI